MLEILFSISFSLFGGNIIDTKLEHHKYEKENYKEVTKSVFQDEDSELFTIDEDADYINNEGWYGYKTLIEEPEELIEIINQLSDSLASVKLELKTLKES